MKEDETFWHKQLNEFIVAVADKLDETHAKLIRRILKAKATHAYNPLTVETEFKLNDSAADEEDFPKLGPKLPALVYAHKIYSLSVSRTSWPLMGISQFLVVTRGTAMICPVDLAILGETEVKDFLADKKNSFVLKKTPWYVLEQGMKLWVPCGKCPLIVGLKIGGKDAKEVDAEDQEPEVDDYLMMLQLPAYSTLDLKLAGDTKSVLTLETQKLLAVTPKFLKPFEVELKEWKHAMESA